MDAVLGQNVTLKTLMANTVYSYIVWNFSDGETQVNIATLNPTELTVKEEIYKGRVSMDKVNGHLTLTGLRATDSGDYSITVIKADGAAVTAEIKLRVLGE